MATNSYFRSTIGVPSEQNIYENMIIESIKIAGYDFIYIPRTLNKFDQLFGEDVLSSFESYVPIEMWIEDFSGYGGESEMLAKFGMEIRDTATFMISRKRFKETVSPIFPASRNAAVMDRPNEGDLIFAPFSKSLFEIKFVEDEYPGFYQLGKKYIWALRCELVQLNNEKFKTGNADIDEYFGTNINRLDHRILNENGDVWTLEAGGTILSEDYLESKPFDEMIGYGDMDIIKKEFSEIMDFTEDSPFGENF
jgi:hypothetical protein